MKALDGFNNVSGYYDTLKRIVFGNAIRASQLHFLPRVSQDHKKGIRKTGNQLHNEGEQVELDKEGWFSHPV